MTLLAQVNRIGWSSYDKITIKDESSKQNISEMPQEYEDIYSFAVGMQYRATDDLTFRTGVRFEETPTIDKYRTTDVPDATTWVCALGMDYHVANSLIINASYVHQFYDTAEIDLIRPGLMAGQEVHIQAEAETQLNGLLLGLTYHF